MTRTAPLAIALAAVGAASLTACDCGPTEANQKRYACVGDDQCAEGFACIGGECRRPEDAGHLVFATGAQTLAAGACSAQVTLEARNGAGAPWVVAADTVVDLAASPSAGFAFFSDAACAVEVSSATIAQGQGSTSFWFRGTGPGVVTISATSTTLGIATQVEAVQTGIPTALGFATPPQTVAAGQCSGTMRVESRNAAGNPTSVAAGTSIALGASPSTGVTFFSDASCATPVTSAAIAGGSSSSSAFFFKGTRAGTVTVSVTAAALSGTSQMESVVAGPPAALAITTAGQLVTAGACSGAVTVEVQDAFGNPAAVTSTTPVDLSASPGAGFSFSGDGSCSGAATAVNVLIGASSAVFYFRGTAAGVTTITGSSPLFGSAFQVEMIAPGPPASLEISTPSQTVLARACSSAVTLTFRDAYGNAAPVASSTTVPLSSAPASGPVFFGDATCGTAIAAATFPAGASGATVFFSGRTGGPFSVIASPSGLAAVGQPEVILPTVRRGTCTISSSATSAACPINPAQLDLAKTFLVFQAVPGDDGAPSSANVRCRFGSTSAITCSRDDVGAVDVSVAWQTVELPSGIRVQHVDAACGASNVVSVPIAAVGSMADTFVLASHEEFGINQDDDDMAMVELTSPTNVDLTLFSTCTWAISLEVVELTGISVTAGRVQLPSVADTAAATGLPAAGPGSTVVLHSHDTGIPSSGGICDRVVRGEVDSDTSVSFRRGNGNTMAVCADQDLELAYQRIDFGALASVQQVQASMPPGTFTADVTIGSVDPTRSLVLSGGQPMSGQAMGETDYDADDVIGEAAALHLLTSATNLQLIRGSGNAPAQWSAFVIQFE